MDSTQLKKIVSLAEKNLEKDESPQMQLLSGMILLQVEQLRGINAMAKQTSSLKEDMSEWFGNLLDAIENRLWPLVVEWDVQEEKARGERSDEAKEARKKSPFEQDEEKQDG